MVTTVGKDNDNTRIGGEDTDIERAGTRPGEGAKPIPASSGPASTGSVLWCRLPGLLSRAAREGVPSLAALDPALDPARAPVAVSQGRRLLDVDPNAPGVAPGESVTRARRILPTLSILPREEVDERRIRALSHRLYDALADIAPVVEPAGPDAAFAAGALPQDIERLRVALRLAFPGLSPVLGRGVSKLAARATGESSAALPGGESSSALSGADIAWIWPEDAAVTGGLWRLGLATFGDVAALPEGALVPRFGPRVAALLAWRSRGHDGDPVRALWPPREIRLVRGFDLDPIASEDHLDRLLLEMATRASGELSALGRHGRVVRLLIETEGRRSVPTFDGVREGRPPWPVQSLAEIVGCLRRLRPPTRAAVTRVEMVVAELEVPPSRSLSLFDEAAPMGDIASRRRLAMTKRLLTSRYGRKALRSLSELPVEPRDLRRQLARAAGNLGGIL